MEHSHFSYPRFLKMTTETDLRTNDFDYDLPEDLIAQQPLEQRDASRLLVLDRSNGQLMHRHFRDISDYFEPGDVLVINQTQVIPARLIAHRKSGAKVELLLHKPLSDGTWETLVKPGRKAPIGEILHFSGSDTQAHVLDILENGARRIRFEANGDFFQWLDQVGHVPLPPYIKRNDTNADRQRYQTVYAAEKGAVAAPTAGLHFTEDILANLRQSGVQIATITLHVGLGTFRPVKVDRVQDHRMDAEYYAIDPDAAQMINTAQANGHRIVATGTTCVRTLESAAKPSGQIEAGRGWTDIFIYPPYQFKIVDRLITNFHLPKSTLIMLVSALAGKDWVMRAYQEAVRERYRFYSYGDAMLIL